MQGHRPVASRVERVDCGMDPRPSVLCIGGHDPTGGAGLQADIETLTALGVRAYTLVTCLTEQDTNNVHGLWPTPERAFRRQRDRLLSDVQPQAIKVGLLGSEAVATAVAELLDRYEGPVVVDPVLRAGGGRSLGSDPLRDLMLEALLTHSTLATPNRAELVQLAGVDDLDDAARRLLQHGLEALLVTGADDVDPAHSDQVTHVLHRPYQAPLEWNWLRLPHVYHGSGCTLASACAAGLASGLELIEAVERAQQFTWGALDAAEHPGQGQHLPNRST
jgi:hydroxymethylpyrimidine/phosphomethylpyrimidine kinase